MKEEARVQSKIKKYIKRTYPGALVEKIHGNIYQRPGISDLLCCINGRFVAIEVKRPGKKPREDQLTFLESVRNADGIGMWADSVEDVKEELNKL